MRNIGFGMRLITWWNWELCHDFVQDDKFCFDVYYSYGDLRVGDKYRTCYIGHLRGVPAFEPMLTLLHFDGNKVNKVSVLRGLLG